MESTTATKTAKLFKPANHKSITSDPFIKPEYCKLSKLGRSDLLEAMEIYVNDHDKWISIFGRNRRVKCLGTFEQSYKDWKDEVKCAILDYYPSKDPNFDNYRTPIVDGHPFHLFKMTNTNHTEGNFILFYLNKFGFEESIGSYMQWFDSQIRQNRMSGVEFVQQSFVKWKLDSMQEKLAKYEKEIEDEVGHMGTSGYLAAYRKASYGESAIGYLDVDKGSKNREENIAKIEAWHKSEIERLFPSEEKEKDMKEDEEASLIKKAISSAMMAFSAANRNAGKAQLQGSSEEDIKSMFNNWWDTNFIAKITKVIGDKIKTIATTLTAKILTAPRSKEEKSKILSSDKPKFAKTVITGLEQIRQNLLDLWMFKVQYGLACGLSGSSKSKYGENVGSVSSMKYGRAGKKEPTSNTRAVPAISGGGKGFDCYVG